MKNKTNKQTRTCVAQSRKQKTSGKKLKTKTECVQKKIVQSTMHDFELIKESSLQRHCATVDRGCVTSASSRYVPRYIIIIIIIIPMTMFMVLSI